MLIRMRNKDRTYEDVLKQFPAVSYTNLFMTSTISYAQKCSWSRMFTGDVVIVYVYLWKYYLEPKTIWLHGTHSH